MGRREPVLRMAVAGSGAMARYHVRRFNTIDRVIPVACYDRSRQRAREFAHETSLTSAYNDLDELLEAVRPDLLTVAAADSQHYELASKALKHGTPVFLEKPFTRETSEAEQLVDLQRSEQVPLTVNFSKINYPAIHGLLHAVRAGVIGTVRELELRYLQSWMLNTAWGEWWREPRWLWRISSSHGGGGALRDLGSHLVFLAITLAGDVTASDIRSGISVDRTRALSSGFSCDMNDSFAMELSFHNGAVATVTGSYATPGRTNCVHIRVAGTAGSAEVTAEKTKDLLAMRRGTTHRTVRYAKVYSTYDAFVNQLLAGAPWAAFEPSAASGLAVQRLLEGM